MKNSNRFLIALITYTVLLWVTSLLFSQSLVLGNSFLSPMLAAALSGLLLTILYSISPAITKALKWKRKNGTNVLIQTWVTSSIGLWIVARGASLTGLGISSFWVAILFGLVTSIILGRVEAVVRPTADM